MAAPNVTLDGVVQDDAESATWSTGSTDADSEVQGNSCIGTKVSNSTATSTVMGTTRNFSAGQANEGDHMVHWLNCSTPTLNTKANGGFRSNIGGSEWYVGGQDNRKPGWGAYVIDPTSTPTTGSPITSSNVFGGTISTNSNIMGNFNNGLWDQITIGKGLIIADGDAASPADFAAAWLADAGTKANKWGWIRVDNGVYFAQGKLQFVNAYVRMSGQVVVFEDNDFVSDTFYEIGFATSDVLLGEFGGNIYRSAGVKRFTWSDTSGVIENGGLIDNALEVNSHSAATWNGTTIKDSGQLNQNGSQLNGVLIKNGTGVGIVVDTLGNIDGLGVTDCAGAGIDLTSQTSTDITLTNIVATGNSPDIIVNNAADVTINSGDGSQLGTVTNIGAGNAQIISGLVTLTFEGLDAGSILRIFASEGGAIIFEAQESGGAASYTYSYTGPSTIYVKYTDLDTKIQSFSRTLKAVNETVTLFTPINRQYGT